MAYHTGITNKSLADWGSKFRVRIQSQSLDYKDYSFRKQKAAENFLSKARTKKNFRRGFVKSTDRKKVFNIYKGNRSDINF